MSFRTRVTLLVALAVAVSVTLVALVAWLAARNELVDQIDASLASRVEGDPGGWPGHQPHGGPIFGADETAQIIDSDGDVVRPRATPLLPVDDADIALAAGADPGTARTRTVEIDGEPYRVLTAALSDGFAVQIATPLSDTYAFLRRLGVTLVVIAVVIAVRLFRPSLRWAAAGAVAALLAVSGAATVLQWTAYVAVALVALGLLILIVKTGGPDLVTYGVSLFWLGAIPEAITLAGQQASWLRWNGIMAFVLAVFIGLATLWIARARNAS